MKKTTKRRLALFGLYAGYLITAIAPILIVVVLNRASYFSTPARSVSITFAGGIALGILVLQMLGKMPKNMHQIIKLGLLTLVCWSINAIIDEICLLMTCAFAGETIAWAAFTIPIKKLKDKGTCEKAMEFIKEAEELSGRV